MLVTDLEHDATLALIRTAAAELKCCSNPDPSLIKRLEALIAIESAETLIKDRERDAERSRRREGPPDGYEMTMSGGLYGFRKRGTTETITWLGSLPRAIRAAWDHVEEAVETVSKDVITTNEFTVQFASITVQRAMMDALLCVRNARRQRERIATLIENMAVADAVAVRILEHLVGLGYLEEVLSDVDNEANEEQPKLGTTCASRVFKLGHRAEIGEF